MKSQIEILKRDIEVHKEIEKELAKRSHTCQKVIKKLKIQVKELESERQELMGQKNGIQSLRAINSQILNTGGILSQNGTNDDEAINQLENQLEEIEKKLINTQNEYEILQNEYMDLQDRMYLYKEKYKRAALLLTDFLDDIINSTPNILQTDKDLLANLEKM